jgi:hypothetical protein
MTLSASLDVQPCSAKLLEGGLKNHASVSLQLYASAYTEVLKVTLQACWQN